MTIGDMSKKFGFLFTEDAMRAVNKCLESSPNDLRTAEDWLCVVSLIAK